MPEASSHCNPFAASPPLTVGALIVLFLPLFTVGLGYGAVLPLARCNGAPGNCPAPMTVAVTREALSRRDRRAGIAVMRI